MQRVDILSGHPGAPACMGNAWARSARTPNSARAAWRPKPPSISDGDEPKHKPNRLLHPRPKNVDLLDGWWVQVTDQIVFITQLTAANGTLLLSNVTLACVAGGTPLRLPCMARPVSDSQALADVLASLQAPQPTSINGDGGPGAGAGAGAGAGKGNVSGLPARPASVLLSLTAQYTMLPGWLGAAPLQMLDPTLRTGMRIGFYGRPSGQLMGATGKDVSGTPPDASTSEAMRVDATSSVSRESSGSGSASASVLDLRSLAGAFFYSSSPLTRCPQPGWGGVSFNDLTLLNLPYPPHMSSWMDMTAVTGHVVQCVR